ncbi:unnamed protein product [Lota lota]
MGSVSTEATVWLLGDSHDLCEKRNLKHGSLSSTSHPEVGLHRQLFNTGPEPEIRSPPPPCAGPSTYGLRYEALVSGRCVCQQGKLCCCLLTLEPPDIGG